MNDSILDTDKIRKICYSLNAAYMDQSVKANTLDLINFLLTYTAVLEKELKRHKVDVNSLVHSSIVEINPIRKLVLD